MRSHRGVSATFSDGERGGDQGDPLKWWQRTRLSALPRNKIPSFLFLLIIARDPRFIGIRGVVGK